MARKRSPVCTRCGGERTYSHLRDAWCRKCKTEYTQTKNSTRIESGLCTRCGVAPANGSMQRCKPCSDRDGSHVRARRREKKLRAIEYLGGECLDCHLKTEIVEVFEFHHLNQLEKDQHVCKLLTKSWEIIVKELDKCVLLCANCHRIRHAETDTYGRSLCDLYSKEELAEDVTIH